MDFEYGRKKNLFIKALSTIGEWFKRIFNRKEFFTLMVVPHTSEKPVRSLKFSKLLVSSFVLLNIIMFTVVCIFGFSYRSLTNDLNKKRAEYEILQTQKEQDEKKLQEYRANETVIKDKIEILKDLESKLKDIIESKGSTPQSLNTDIPALASRGSGGALYSEDSPLATSYNGEGTTEEFESFEEMYQTVDEMVNLVDQRVEELNAAIEKAEKLEKIMRAKPSVLPTTGHITSTFGYRKNPFTNRGREFHSGIDIANKKGTPIKASGDGVVVFAGRDGGYGKVVKIDHQNGYVSIYGHNSELKVEVGDKVSRGQVIALMGSTGRSTGSHCHFEVQLHGKPIDPKDVK